MECMKKEEERPFKGFPSRGLDLTLLIALTLTVLILGGAGCMPPPSRSGGQGPQSAPRSEPSLADTLMGRGAEAFDRGAFGEAIAHWSEAAGLFEREKRSKERLETLMKLSGLYKGPGIPEHRHGFGQGPGGEKDNGEGPGAMGKSLSWDGPRSGGRAVP